MSDVCRRRALSRIEMIVLIACIVVVLAIVAVSWRLLNSPTRGPEITMRDQSNLRAIHQGLILHAGEQNGLYLRPGLLAREPINVGGELQRVPGRGDEDLSQNTTDNFYSAMIMRRYIGLEDLISPGELNPTVRVMASYDFDLYSPVEGVYWDPAFQANLEAGSHVSYAPMLLYGIRRNVLWNERARNVTPLIGSRGPEDGVPDAESYTCNANAEWIGAVVTNGNETPMLESMIPPNLFYGRGGEEAPDNLFAMEDGPEGEDVTLTFTTAITEDGPVIQHD